MADNTTNPTAMTAKIDLVVDDAQTKRSMNQAGHTVKQSLDRIEATASKQVQAQLAQRTQQIANALKSAANQMSSILKVGLGGGLGAGTSAVTAFLRSNTAEAMRFKSRLAEVQTALGGVGQKLATQVKFGDKSMYEWAEKLTGYLNNLSTDKLQKAADIAKKIALTLAGIKVFSFGAGLVGSLAQVYSAIATARGVAGVSDVALAAKSTAPTAAASALGGGLGARAITSTGGLNVHDATVRFDDAIAKVQKADVLKRRTESLMIAHNELANNLSTLVESKGAAWEQSLKRLDAAKRNPATTPLRLKRLTWANEQYQERALAALAELRTHTGPAGSISPEYSNKYFAANSARDAESAAVVAAEQLQTAKDYVEKTTARTGKLLGGKKGLVTAGVVAGTGGASGVIMAGLPAVLGFDIARRTIGKKQHGYKWGYSEALAAVAQEGLAYNIGGGDQYLNGGQGGMMYIGTARASATEREASRAAVMRRYLGGDQYQRNLKSMFGYSELATGYAREDATSLKGPKYDDLKGRLPELSKALKEADVSAAEFKAIRDRIDKEGNRVYAIGSQGFANYDQHYQEAQSRGTTIAGYMANIEKLKIAELKDEEDRLERNKKREENAQARTDAINKAYAKYEERRDKGREKSDKSFSRSKTKIYEAIEKAGETRGALSLGVGVASMPNLSAQRIEAAEDIHKQWKENMVRLNEELTELARDKVEVDNQNRLDDKIAAEERDENIADIRKALIGELEGSPAE